MTTLDVPAAFAGSPARALVCRECGHEVPLSPVHVCDRCWAPLEVGYDLEKLQPVRRASGATRVCCPPARTRRRASASAPA
jgi:threonine synthase